MSELHLKFHDAAIPAGYISVDIERWRDEIATIFLELSFYEDLLSAFTDSGKIGEQRRFLAGIREMVSKTKAIQQDFIRFTNRFEGRIECEDIHCETLFLNAFADFRTVAEKHLTQYRSFKSGMLSYLQTD